MRLRNVKDKYEILSNSTYIINNYYDYKGKWHTKFNNNPIYLEIGPGKCGHIVQSAIKNPNINYIGIEQNASILALAVKKIIPGIPNLLLINANADSLDDIFNKEINTIYLNFSDPWPKKRHANRRLTSEKYLKIYDNIFEKKCRIRQKTDNQGLFESSLISYSNSNYKIKEISLDYHKVDDQLNIMTEYETKFFNKNKPIYMVIVEK